MKVMMASQKNELWEFLQTVKAGMITKSDFECFRVCIDSDDSGKVDFLELYKLTAKCHKEHDNASNPPVGLEEFNDNS